MKFYILFLKKNYKKNLKESEVINHFHMTKTTLVWYFSKSCANTFMILVWNGSIHMSFSAPLDCWVSFSLINFSMNDKIDQGELARIFQIFNWNRDGRIIKKSLETRYKILGFASLNNFIFQMIEKINVNGDEYVDIDEFSEFYLHPPTPLF